jgi:hypothetical protein
MPSPQPDLAARRAAWSRVWTLLLAPPENEEAAEVGQNPDGRSKERPVRDISST